MSSSLTNVGAMAARQSIDAGNRQIAATWNRISTGLRVESAKGDTSPWPIATAIRGDMHGPKAVSENMALSISAISVAREGAETIASLLTQTKEKVIQASGAGVDTGQIQADVDRFLSQINSVANAAAFNGVNLTTTASGLNIASLDVTAAGALASVETAIAAASDAAAAFSSVQMRLQIQSDFVEALADALSAGAGSLADANMEEEAARLGALQVQQQQQLGLRSLSIASSAPQSILALFR